MTISEVTTTLVDSMKSQPLVIGLLVVNVLFVGIMFVAVREARIHEHAEFRIIFDRCIPAPRVT